MNPLPAPAIRYLRARPTLARLTVWAINETGELIGLAGRLALLWLIAYALGFV
jgi:hypothetical protein